MYLKQLLLFFFTAFIFNNNAIAQQLTKVRDVGLWIGLKVKYQFKKDFELSVAQDLRLFESLTQVSKANSEIGFKYTINKNFSIGTDARYSHDRKKDNSYGQDFRMNYDFMVKFKVANKLKLKFRIRYQHLHENLLNLKKYKRDARVNNFRSRIGLDYSIKKHQPFLSFELFRQFEVSRKPHFNKFRIKAGDEVDWNKHEIKYSIGYERDLGLAHPLHYIFASIYYTLEFKNEKYKQKK